MHLHVLPARAGQAGPRESLESGFHLLHFAPLCPHPAALALGFSCADWHGGMSFTLWGTHMYHLEISSNFHACFGQRTFS